jgi:hypothetical protein
MREQGTDIPSGYSYPASAAWLAAGAVVTAVFSGSLAALTSKAELAEVLAVGMLVPSFTWVVQLTAATIGLAGNHRRFYVGDLGRICLIGSLALLPAAVVNLLATHPPDWLSPANVVASVGIMGAVLHRRATQHDISPAWPTSWLLTISLNMALFLLASRNWW